MGTRVYVHYCPLMNVTVLLSESFFFLEKIGMTGHKKKDTAKRVWFSISLIHHEKHDLETFQSNSERYIYSSKINISELL